MNLTTISFARLELARARSGHTVEQAAAAIGVSAICYYKWRTVFNPTLESLRGCEQYIRESRRAK